MISIQVLIALVSVSCVQCNTQKRPIVISTQQPVPIEYNATSSTSTPKLNVLPNQKLPKVVVQKPDVTQNGTIPGGPLVEIPGLGKVKGSAGKSQFTNRTIYSFKSIPYAQPPVGDLRFKYPVPVASWGDKVLDATEYGACCPQRNLLSYYLTKVQTAEGSEDCLHISVHTPRLPDASKPTSPGLPVLFFIHGGSFMYGRASWYGPAKFLERDVILVVVQYRLGPLGFLSLQTDDIPGNAGLMDQLEGLRWVKQNIKYFGGDPSRVTIFGQSAGAASVTFLQMSPLAKGLFNRVICQSGSALGEWIIVRNPEGNAKSFGEKCNCTYLQSNDLAACFRNISWDKITEAHLQFVKEQRYNGYSGFAVSGPVVQTSGALRILDERPEELAEIGNFTHVPGLFGATKDEGSFVLAMAYLDYIKARNLQNNSDFMRSEIIPKFLSTIEIPDSSHVLAKSLQRHYLGNKEGTFIEMANGLKDLIGAVALKAPTYQMAKANAVYNNSYFYSFDYKGRQGAFSLLFPAKDIPFEPGVTHGDDVPYLFTPELPEMVFKFSTQLNLMKNLNKQEKEISIRMIEMWTNFAATGDPTPLASVKQDGLKWTPMNTSNPSYLSIGEDLVMKNISYEDTWDTFNSKDNLTLKSSANSFSAHAVIVAIAIAILLN